MGIEIQSENKPSWRDATLPVINRRVLVSEDNRTAVLLGGDQSESIIIQGSKALPDRVIKALVSYAEKISAEENSAESSAESSKESQTHLFNQLQKIAGSLDLTVHIPGTTMTPVPLSSRLTPLPKPPTNDKATGLPNRRVLLSDESLSQLLNGFDGPLRVAFLDFVGMGATNKFGIGTAYTDKALRRFAGVVKSAAKQSNIIVKAVRLGGDEFALIAPNMTDDKWNEFLGNLETKWLEARNRVVKKLAYSEKKNLEKAESYVLTKGLLRDLMQPTIAQPADDLKRFTINTFRIGSAVTSSNTWDLNAINAALLIAEQEMLAKKASNGERENSSNASEATQLNEKPSASEENPTKLSDITYRLRDVLEAPLNQLGVGNETVQFVRLNIVNFGLINNAFGHETGDKVLLFFAEKIKRFAGDNSVLIHMGGGAFGVFVSEGVSEITETFGDNLADGFTNALFPYLSQEAGYSYKDSNFKEIYEAENLRQKLDNLFNFQVDKNKTVGKVEILLARTGALNSDQTVRTLLETSLSIRPSTARRS